jgi:hypothetical protein
LSDKRGLLNPKLIQQLAKDTHGSLMPQKSQNGCLVVLAWYQLPTITPVSA